MSLDTKQNQIHECTLCEFDFKRKGFKFCIGVDDSKCSLHASEFAMALANKLDKIHMIHVPDGDQSAIVKKRFQTYVEKNKKQYSFEILKPSSNSQTVNEQLKQYVNSQPESKRIDFIVTGKHGATHEVTASKPSHTHVGSLADTSLREIGCTSMSVPRMANLIPYNNKNNNENNNDDNLSLSNTGPWTAVVGVDGSNNSESALKMATLLLQTNNNNKNENKNVQNQLYIVHVRNPHQTTTNQLKPLKSSEMKERYTKFAQLTTKQTGIMTKFEMIDGEIVSKPLCDYAQSKNAQLIFVGEDGIAQTLEHKGYLGSVSDKVVKIAACAVVVSHVNIVDRLSSLNMQAHED